MRVQQQIVLYRRHPVIADATRRAERYSYGGATVEEAHATQKQQSIRRYRYGGAPTQKQSAIATAALTLTTLITLTLNYK